MKKSRF
nr:unnamed protein product [Timema cristinae]